MSQTFTIDGRIIPFTEGQTIIQAATAAGYSDVSHFYRACRQFYGMTPRESRDDLPRPVRPLSG